MLPIENIREKYKNNNLIYGIIQYSNYPLLSPGNKNFSENVFSINFFNENLVPQKIQNLTENVELYIKKPDRSFNTCLFIDSDYKWNDYGCKSTDMGDILLCSCDHLTDFSSSKYNPVNIAKDLMEVIFDAWIINSLAPFGNLSFGNATVFYIFFSILIIYLIGLKFTMKYDKEDQNDEYDKYIYKTDYITKMCSSNFENVIEEVKEDIQKSEQERLKETLKNFNDRAEKFKLDTILLKHLHLDVVLPKFDINKSKRFYF